MSMLTFVSQRLRLIGVLVSLLLVFASSKSALAHAELVRAEPIDGATLAAPPRTIHLWFNEAVVPSFSTVQILDAHGQPQAGVTVYADPAERKALIVNLSTLPAGAYTLLWKALSAVDGHFSQGMMLFGVQMPPPADPVVQVQPVPVSRVEVLLRWLNFTSLAGIVGALAVVLFLYRPSLRNDEQGRMTSWQQVQQRLYRATTGWAVLAGLIGGGLLVNQIFTLQQATTNTTPWWQAGGSILTQTSWGGWWLARQSLLVLLIGLLVWPRDPAQRSLAKRWQRVLMIEAGVALLIIQALMGHAAGNTRNPWIAVPMTALHLLAASLWVGGLCAVLVGWLPLIIRQPERRSELLWLGFQPFTRLAVISVFLLIVTGLYNTGQQVPSLDALITTGYGQLLLSKLGLVLITGGIGLLNTILLQPTLVAPLARRWGQAAGWRPVSLQRLPLLVSIELVVGAAILFATGMLTATPPPRGVEFTLGPEDERSSLSQTVEDLQVTLEVKPNRPGQNVFSVRSVSDLDPPPAPIIRVLLRFTYLDEELGRVSVKAEEIEPGRYLLNGNYLKLAGPWQIEVVTRRYGREDSVARFHWVVMPANALPPTVLSKQPLATPLTLTTVATLLLGVFGLLAWRWRGVLRVFARSRPVQTSYPSALHTVQVHDSSQTG